MDHFVDHWNIIDSISVKRKSAVVEAESAHMSLTNVTIATMI